MLCVFSFFFHIFSFSFSIAFTFYFETSLLIFSLINQLFNPQKTLYKNCYEDGCQKVDLNINFKGVNLKMK